MKILKDGTRVNIQPMLAYPDGLLLGVELTSIVLPVVGALPSSLLSAIKAALAGEESADEESWRTQLAELVTRDGSDQVLSAVLNGIAGSIVQIGDRARFMRIASPLLACLFVEQNGQMVELKTPTAVQMVTGTNIAKLVELLVISLGANFASFFSGSGAAPADPSVKAVG